MEGDDVGGRRAELRPARQLLERRLLEAAVGEPAARRDPPGPLDVGGVEVEAPHLRRRSRGRDKRRRQAVPAAQLEVREPRP